MNPESLHNTVIGRARTQTEEVWLWSHMSDRGLELSKKTLVKILSMSLFPQTGEQVSVSLCL